MRMSIRPRLWAVKRSWNTTKALGEHDRMRTRGIEARHQEIGRRNHLNRMPVPRLPPNPGLPRTAFRAREASPDPRDAGIRSRRALVAPRAASVARKGSESRPELGAAGVSEREPVAILPRQYRQYCRRSRGDTPASQARATPPYPGRFRASRPAACTRERPGNFCHSEPFCRPRQKRLAIPISMAAETVSHCKKMS